MGVGKSLMMLSLILATLHQPCTPPSASIDISPVTTSHRVQHSPFHSDQQLRDMTGSTPGPQLNLHRFSLVDMCLDILAVNEPAVDRSPFFPPHLKDSFRRRQPFYYQYPPDDSCMRQAKRRMLKREARRFYLANTTLLVCPAILVNQWLQEIDKHLLPDTLRVLRVDSEKLLPIECLVTYDVSITSPQDSAAAILSCRSSL